MARLPGRMCQSSEPFTIPTRLVRFYVLTLFRPRSVPLSDKSRRTEDVPLAKADSPLAAQLQPLRIAIKTAIPSMKNLSKNID